MKNKKFVITVFLLLMILVFSACSKKSESLDTDMDSTSGVPESGKTSDKAADGSTVKSEPITDAGSKVDSGKTGSKDESLAAMDRISSEKTSAVKESGSSSYESDAAETRTYGADVILSESKYSLKGDFSEGASFYAPDVADSIGDYYYDDGEVYIYDPDIILPEPTGVIDRPQLRAGILTAGEWNDNRNFDFIKKLMSGGQNYDYKSYFTKWGLSPFSRLVITVKDTSDIPVQGAEVTIADANGTSIWKGVTDHTGTAYAYYSLTSESVPSKVVVKYGDSDSELALSAEAVSDTNTVNLTIDAARKAKTLDLMFTVDTTGSMSDEIYYLQTELQDVIKRVQNDTANIPLRLSVNFYRDHGDSYVVRPYEFSTNINEQLAYLNEEYADGGGDFEEAVELALASSINDHKWDEDSIKLLFLVLDAPPHNTEDICSSLQNSISKASELGIRIIPVASSGIDKETEFILRAFAMTTGGTYTFLTDDSGVGGSHIEPTIGEYKVEQLNDLLVRLIEEYIG